MEDMIFRSKPDSIMMKILRSAMDRAQEKLQFKERRPIEFLHEQTTFYQLAAILVEGSVKILEEEEDGTEILESSCSKMVLDLIDIRERLEGRIRDMKRLITERDREFCERLDNEIRLREALDLTERESVQLYDKIGPVIMKMMDSDDEQVLDIKQKLEDERMILDSEIRTRITQRSSPNLGRGLVVLENEKVILNAEKRVRRSFSSPNLSSDFLDGEIRARRSHSNPNLSSKMILNDGRRAKRSRAASPNPSPGFLNKKLFKELGLVMLDEENMISNSESRARRSWASSPNLSPSFLNKKLFKELGLVMLDDEKTILNTEIRSRRSRAPSPNLNLNSLECGIVSMEEDQFMSSGINVLKQTLDLVFRRVQLEEEVPLEKKVRKGIKREVDLILLKGFMRDLQTKFDIEVKKRDGIVKGSWFDFIDEIKSLFHELKDFFSRPHRTTSVPNLEVDFTQILCEYNCNEVGGSHHVWEIVKSHESIIQRQCAQRTRDALQREGVSSWIKRNEDINAMERLIHDAIVRIENFIQRKSRAQERRGRIPKQLKTSHSGSTRTSETSQEDFRCSPAQECTECLLREEVYKTYLTEMLQSRRAQACQADTPRSATPKGGGRESSLIQKLDSLLKSLELEETMMLTASSLIKQHSVSNSLVTAIEWLITDDEGTLCTVSEKLERALQQHYTTKELLVELRQSLEVSDDGREHYENSEFNNILRPQGESTSPCLDSQDVGETDWSESVLETVKRFQYMVVELYENIDGKCLRVEALKHQVDALNQPLAWIKTRKLLYEKAFISRCRSLKLAETEVDLLGDQVETLLSLLEKIYRVLSRNARVLSSYFEVNDILRLIKTELNGGRSSKQKSQIADISSISSNSF
ncbi:hypothetical protein SASPL_136911 [Salvia splendens]|uniref:WPP domain-associated protein n=1 Tax=Salvia splendens TaxID=180675 RepID=A0A8X8X2U5_SALSN|nr:hypothetical protein SASPL_136911 [Salvia splendens]